MKKLLFIPCMLACALHADTNSDDQEILIPEGKLVDYPSIYHDVTPSAGPRVIHGYGLFITGDYIYWTARQDNMQYASTGYANNNVSSPRSGSTANMNYRFQTGFKAGLGFSFSHDYWDTCFNYTWYQSNRNSGSIKGDPGAGLTPTFTPYLPLTADSYYDGANAKWRLHFNSIDWELGRNFYISKFLSLRPFIGLKGTWQSQKFNTQYTGFIVDDAFNYLRNMKSSFMGIGIRTGCNMGWHIAGTWSVFGDIAASSVWGQFKSSRSDSSTVADTSLNPVSASNQIHSATPVLELAIGIRKDQWFLNNRLHVGVQAGWEEQIWLDQNQFASNLGTSSDGNLVLQGLTVRLRFDF